MWTSSFQRNHEADQLPGQPSPKHGPEDEVGVRYVNRLMFYFMSKATWEFLFFSNAIQV